MRILEHLHNATSKATADEPEVTPYREPKTASVFVAA